MHTEASGYLATLRFTVFLFCFAIGRTSRSSEENMGGIISSSLVPKSPRPNEGTPGNAGRESWNEIKAIGVDKLGMAVFEKLFEVDPKVFQMFKTFREDPNWRENKAFRSHCKLVMNVLGSAVVNDQSEEELRRTMHTIGSAHSIFEITREHFAVLNKELIVQLKLLLGDKFTPAVEKAWKNAAEKFSSAMIAAMEQGSVRQHGAESTK